MSRGSHSQTRHNKYDEHNLKIFELNGRLSKVKKEFGMRRAISSRSLTGETVSKS